MENEDRQSARPIGEGEQSAPDAASPATEYRSRWHGIRGVLVALLVLAVFHTLYITRAVAVPIVLALLLNFLLRPVVRGIRRIGLPYPLGALVVLVALLGLVSLGVARLSAPAGEWARKGPQLAQQIERKLKALRRPIQKVQETASSISKVTSLGGAKPRATVELEQSTFVEVLLSSTGSFLGSLAIVTVLLFLLLASGDLIERKLQAALPQLGAKRLAVEIVRETEGQISYYLVTVTLINGGVGCLVGITAALVNLPNPALWGVVAGLCNFIPYLGPFIGISLVGAVGLFTFSDPLHALIAPIVYFGIAAMEGNVITPMILGRRFALNPVVIFLSLVLWSGIWGISGALLAVPMLVAAKIVCERVRSLAPIGEFLGR